MVNISAFEDLAAFLQVLGQPARLQILMAIGPGETCVCHLEETFGWRQAYLSQHLMALRKAGLLLARREGRFVYYRLDNPNLLQFLQQLAAMRGSSLPEPICSPDCPCPHCHEQKDP